MQRGKAARRREGYTIALSAAVSPPLCTWRTSVQTSVDAVPPYVPASEDKPAVTNEAKPLMAALPRTGWLSRGLLCSHVLGHGTSEKLVCINALALWQRGV
jgi:hypothetical protein